MKRKYENGEAVDKVEQVLELLSPGWNDRTVRTLWNRDPKEPYVEVALYNSGYTREEYSSSDYYLLTPRVVVILLELGCLDPTPYWGYSDPAELKINDRGFAFLREIEATKSET